VIRRFSTNFALLSMLVDGALVALCVWLAVVLRPMLSSLPGVAQIASPISLPRPLYVWFPLLWIAVSALLSVYDGRRYLRAVDEFTIVTAATLLWAGAAAGILYLSYRDVSRFLFIFFVLLVYIACVGWRVLARAYFRRARSTAEPARRVVIVGSGPLGQRVHAQLERSDVENLLVIGFVDDRGEAATPGVRLLGGFEALRDIVRTRQVSDLVVALPHSAYERLGELVQALEDVPVRVWVALGFFDLALYRTGIEDFEGIPMLDLRAAAIDDYQRMVKRALDFCLAILLLAASFPVMALAALLILLDDGLPVLFRQDRIGENGRVFKMIKFRTMVRNAESIGTLANGPASNDSLVHKSRSDPRVTRIGKLLRRLSIDELPQFLNVIRGEMSIVGPRPELPNLVSGYQPWQRKRFAVPPGITGWWQIQGRSDRPMHLHTEDDLYYIQHYSVWLDIEILIRTAWAVLLGRGAY